MTFAELTREIVELAGWRARLFPRLAREALFTATDDELLAHVANGADEYLYRYVRSQMTVRRAMLSPWVLLFLEVVLPLLLKALIEWLKTRNDGLRVIRLARVQGRVWKRYG